MGAFSDNYYSWLDRMMSETSHIGSDSFTGSLKDFLVNRLDDRDVSAQDSAPKIRDDIFGKRKVGRPRKDNDSVFKREGFAEGIIKEEHKEKARKLDRLNPQPTEKLKHLQDIEVGLRELGYDVADVIKSIDEIETMLADIDSLRKEAGIKKIDESFDPYAKFRDATRKYIERKNTFTKYFNAAKESLGKQEERKSEELLASLKEEPKVLKDSYQTVVDTYSKLCDSLTAIIDNSNDGDEKGERIGEGEVEKNGFGLIAGENFKSYSNRMKSIGRGKEIPKTIRDIEDKIEKTERQWRSVAGISLDEFEKVKENWKRSVQMLMTKCSLACNMKIAEVNDLLGGKELNTERKPKGREKSDGIIGDSVSKASNDVKYGCLHSITPTQRDNEIGESYGGIVVRWKKHCVVSTMTFGDSIDIESSDTTFETPCLVTDASPCCFNPLKQDAVNALKNGVLDIGLETSRTIFGIPYIELQFHGDGWYKPQSVDSISFECEDDIRNLSQSAIEQIVKNKIAVYVKDDKVKIADIEGVLWS